MEQHNDQRLQDLAGKLASIRQVTGDIYAQATDQSVLDSATETFSSLVGNIRGSAGRLSRAAQAGHPIVRTSGIAIAVILVIYILVHFFW